MLSFNYSVEVAADADSVWALVGDFSGWSRWHPWVTAVELEPANGGVGRKVHINGGTAGSRTLTEKLVFFDLNARELAYTIVAGNPPFQDYVGRLRVLSLGPGKSLLDFYARFRPADGRTQAEALERVETFYTAGLSNVPRLF